LYKHAFHPGVQRAAGVDRLREAVYRRDPICAATARFFCFCCAAARRSRCPERIGEKEWEEKLTEYSPRHVESIPSQVLFLDAIAKEIGCLPDTRELLADPVLLAKLWSCTFNQASYRLTGPHSMRDVARSAIMREELPARSVSFAALFLAMSSFPSTVQPDHADLIEFPFVLEPELEKLVRASLETIASRAARHSPTPIASYGPARSESGHDALTQASESTMPPARRPTALSLRGGARRSQAVQARARGFLSGVASVGDAPSTGGAIFQLGEHDVASPQNAVAGAKFSRSCQRDSPLCSGLTSMACYGPHVLETETLRSNPRFDLDEIQLGKFR
jgi:hypothetical protein